MGTRIRRGIALYIFYRFYTESHIEQSEGLQSDANFDAGNTFGPWSAEIIS